MAVVDYKIFDKILAPNPLGLTGGASADDHDPHASGKVRKDA